MQLVFSYIVLGLIYIGQFAVPFAVCWLFQNWLRKAYINRFLKLVPMASLVLVLFLVICNEMTFKRFFLLINIISGLAGMLLASLRRFLEK